MRFWLIFVAWVITWLGLDLGGLLLLFKLIRYPDPVAIVMVNFLGMFASALIFGNAIERNRKR